MLHFSTAALSDSQNLRIDFSFSPDWRRPGADYRLEEQSAELNANSSLRPPETPGSDLWC